MWFFLDPFTSYSVDWWSHLFSIDYFGEYVRQHFLFPTLMNTNVIVGAPNALFYGTLFYPIVGALASVLGGNIAVRLAIIFAFALQTWNVYRTAQLFTRNQTVSFTVTIAANSAIYALTNLYVRADLTEYAGISLLMSAIAVWLRIAHTPKKRFALTVFVGLMIGLAAGANPIVFIIGNPCLLFIMALTIASPMGGDDNDPVRRRRLLLSAVIVFAIEIAMLAPWLYAYFSYQPFVPVSSLFARGPMYWPGIDDFWVRFRTYPFDGRMGAPTLPPTPNLDAQLNIALVVFIGFLAYEARLIGMHWKRLWAPITCAAAALALALYSSIPALGVAFHVLSTIQFAYRLVSYVDALLLATALLMLLAMRQDFVPHASRYNIALAIVAVLALQTCFIKEGHADFAPSIATSSGLFENRDALSTVWQTAAVYALPVSAPVPPAPTDLHVPIVTGTGAAFGVAKTISFVAPPGTIVVTNVQSFPWTHLVVNGSVVPADQTMTVTDPIYRYLLAFRSDRATAQSLSVEFDVDPLWMVLRFFALSFTAALVGWLVYPYVRSALKGRRASVIFVEGLPSREI